MTTHHVTEPLTSKAKAKNEASRFNGSLLTDSANQLSKRPKLKAASNLAPIPGSRPQAVMTSEHEDTAVPARAEKGEKVPVIHNSLDCAEIPADAQVKSSKRRAVCPCQ